ncbi:UNVERIFIED_CONTAM: Tetratricopeptide repeat protein 27 [Sesamum calycinum]|uniref:Tetratricopeptide repeat protein 27 n=1 Tax=Sesamum calycinum TaxID=2727403 RepID=A0AAW2QLA1_9LAMI
MVKMLCFRQHFESAAEISNYNFFVSGSLGFRTLHQVEPKAQLRLVAGTNDGDTSAPVSHKSSITDNYPLQQPSEVYEASDILMIPRFVADEGQSKGVEQDTQNNAIAASQLNAVHQAVILAQCLSIEKTARNDELQKWEMAPYIEAIDSQDASPFIVEGVCNNSPGVAQRLYYCFGVNMPSIPALRREYGDLLVSCGLVGEAMKIYEDLELWDNLIYCYQLVDKKTAAVELIKKRLSEKPYDPRLWCSLGDVTNDDASYEKALEVSGNRSGRAFRSLARSAYNRGEDVDKALDAFTRAVQLDPENGEAWNNIACLHMIKKRSKEAFIAFKEALKQKRGNVGELAMLLQILGTLARQWKLYKSNHANSFNFESNVADANGAKGLEVDSASRRETEQLIELLGKILRQIVQSGGSADTWGLYARVYQELALRGSSRRELFAAEMHLKSTIKQAVNFSNIEEYRDLVDCLEDVQAALRSSSLPGA